MQFRHILMIALFFSMLCLGRSAEKINRIILKSTTSAGANRQVVLANMRLKEGGVFNREQLSNDIRKLHATGQFYDIQTTVTASGPGLVNLTIQLEVNPKVRKITFKGNKRVATHTLRAKLVQSEGRFLKESNLANDLSELTTLYTNRGYPGTDIQQKMVPVDDKHEVEIIYTINEEPRAKTWRVKFKGNHSLGHAVLAKQMRTREIFRGNVILWPFAITIKSFMPFFASYFDEAILRADLDQIRKLYWEHGFFDAHIVSTEKRFGKTLLLFMYRRRGTVHVTIEIDEGKRYKVSGVAFKGNVRFSTDELNGGLRLRAGKFFNVRDQEIDIKRIERRYHRLGYLEFRISPEFVADAKTNEVKLIYRIREGRVSRIRDIHISGNLETRDHVIRREFSIQPGDLSDKTSIDRTRSRLRGLGYFDSVDIVPTVVGDDDKWRDLNLKVTEADTGRFSVSLGFSDIDDVVARVEFGQSNFDLFGWGRGFKGAGQRFKINAMAGDDSHSFGVNFTEPWLLNRRLRFDFAFWNRETSANRDYDQDNTGGQIKFTKRLPWRYWRHYLGYRLERVKITDIDITFSPEFIAAEEHNSAVSAVLYGVSRDSRNSYAHPTYGSLVQCSTTYQAEEMGSYTESYKMVISGDLYIPILLDTDLLLPLTYSPIVKLSAQIGHVNRLDGDEIRIFDRFFAGGTGTIRGFEPRVVGPIDPQNSEAVGGKSIFLASVEVLQPLVEKTIYAAVFADAGNVWAGTWEWEMSELNLGVGAGIRLRLPVGNISIDYAWPIGRVQRHLEDSGRVHFNLGYRF